MPAAGSPAASSVPLTVSCWPALIVDCPAVTDSVVPVFAAVVVSAAVFALVVASDRQGHGYGRMLLAGTALPADPLAALKWFRRAADANHLDAINMVGRCLDNGWGAAENPAASVVAQQR